MNFKSGFVNILGFPNVGKSTLMNSLVGEKISIITPKPQTTRQRIMGIVTGDDFQIVYSDTPGILDPKYILHKTMMNYVDMALADADIILFVAAVNDDYNLYKTYINKIIENNTKLIFILNKIDLSNQEFVINKINELNKLFPSMEIIPVSALKAFNTDKIIAILKDLLPLNPPYFPADELSDKSQRFFTAETIREKIFTCYQKEIPYNCEVIIESFKEEDKITRISALIYVGKQSHKAIVIGKNGEALKKVATLARKDIEKILEKKVFLEVYVKVLPDWRNNAKQLKRFGYITDSI
ncbi:MAG: GTPase Era [Bacteroidales bacterium]|nr:GTPase Era [Bacteroidales bacterium]